MILRPKLQTVLLLTFAACAALPRIAPVESPAQPPVARQIQVNVIVRDRHGEPVRDLKKEDFRVYDTGKLQQISAFRIDSNALLPSAHALPPNTFTNWPQKSQAPASVTVILLDSLNSHIEDRQFAEKKVVNLLSAIRPEHRVGVYVLGYRLRILHDFTSDSSLLLKQLARRNGSQLPEMAGSDGTTSHSDTDPAAVAFNAWLSGAAVSREESEFYTVDPVAGTSRAVQFIANHLAGLPGRKNLIWVSGWFPDDAVLALDHANMAIYPVDARGLIREQRFDVERPVFRDPGKPQQDVTMSPAEKLRELESQQSKLIELESRQRKRTTEIAARTGGRAYGNTNDLASVLRETATMARWTFYLFRRMQTAALSAA